MKRTILTLAACAGIAATGGAAGTALLTGSNPASSPSDLQDIAQQAGLPPHPLRAALRALVRNLREFHERTPLTADQKQKVAAILKDHQTDIRAQIEKMRDARRAMWDAVLASGSDSQAVKDAAARIGDAARDGALLRAQIGSEIKPLLTPEQLKSIQIGRQQVDAAVDTGTSQ